jgi:hypothetical protein
MESILFKNALQPISHDRAKRAAQGQPIPEAGRNWMPEPTAHDMKFSRDSFIKSFLLSSSQLRFS